MKKLILFPLMVFVFCLKAEVYTVDSPEKNISIRVNTTEQIYNYVDVNGKENRQYFSPLITLGNGESFNHDLILKNKETPSSNSNIKAVVDCSEIIANQPIPDLTHVTLIPTANATSTEIIVTSDSDTNTVEGCFFSATIGNDEIPAVDCNVIKYGEQYFIYLDHEDTPIYDLLSKPTGGITIKNTSTKNTYSMVADPGLQFVVDISNWDSLLLENFKNGIKKIQARVLISVLNRRGEKDPFQSYLLLTMDGEGHNLDISKPMKFVVPFVDVDWDKDKDYKRELIYNIIVTAYDATGFSIDIPPQYTGELKKSEKSSGKFVSGYFANQMPKGMPMSYENDGVRFENIIYGKDGVWFDLHYPGNLAKPVYLFEKNGKANTNFDPYYSSYGNGILDSLVACYLPYPRIEGLNPLECYIMVEYENKEYRFSPRNDGPNTQIYKGPLLITSAGKSAESSAEKPLGFSAKLKNWFRNLFKK